MTSTQSLLALLALAAAACAPPKLATPIAEIPKLATLKEVMDNQATAADPHWKQIGATTFSDDDFKRQIQDDTGIKPSWSAEAFSDLDEDVRQSIERIKSSPFIPNKDSVRGFVYEVETGRLREVT